jgi:hypothetical protein
VTLQSTFERALMEGDLDTFPFILAEALHITLAQVGQMSNHEYLRWRAWHVYRAAMADLNG